MIVETRVESLRNVLLNLMKTGRILFIADPLPCWLDHASVVGVARDPEGIKNE